MVYRLQMLLATLSGLLLSCFCSAEIRVLDYSDRSVVLEKPAQRIVATSPHIVENIFSAGAGDLIVGTVDYSDYPEAAKKIPRIGIISAFSLEAIVALNPDIVVVWRSGRGGTLLEKLTQLNIKVYADDPRSLEDVARSIRDIGVLSGREVSAQQAADQYLQQLHAIKNQHRDLSEVPVFYQIWHDPIQSLNGDHMISDVITLCGGRNIFADAVPIAPKINIESLVARTPGIIVASGADNKSPPWLDKWRNWAMIPAVKHKQLYHIPPDLIQRHTTRILLGLELMCQYIDQARLRNS